MAEATSSIGIPTASTCNKSREKPYATTGRRTGATDNTRYQLAPMAQPQRDTMLVNLPRVKTTSQSTLGLKVLFGVF